MARRKASTSQILKWLRCPRAWYYRYKQKIYEPKTIPLVRGTLIHSVIEKMFLIDTKQCGINKRNYQNRLPIAIEELFERLLEAPGENFGKPEPSAKEFFISLASESSDEEIELTRLMLRNYISQYMRELEQWVIKFDNFPKAFRETAPKFRELHIDLGNYQAYLDEVFDINGSIMITDLKTSTLSTGKVANSSHYIPSGISGVNDEYILQLFMYAWAYWKKYGVEVDWLSLKYLKYGYEITIPFKFLDRHAIYTAIEALLATFLEATESDDIKDYPMNDQNNLELAAEWSIHNTFCSAVTTRFAGRGYCFYDQFCNEELADVVAAKEIAEAVIVAIGEVDYVVPAWLAKKKGLTNDRYTAALNSETEKAFQVIIPSISEKIWLPKSQVKKMISDG